MAGDRLVLEVLFPKPIFDHMSPVEKKAYEKWLHDALIPAIEDMYETKWKQVFAEQWIRRDNKILPKKFRELFVEWEKRVWGS